MPPPHTHTHTHKQTVLWLYLTHFNVLFSWSFWIFLMSSSLSHWLVRNKNINSKIFGYFLLLLISNFIAVKEHTLNNFNLSRGLMWSIYYKSDIQRNLGRQPTFMMSNLQLYLVSWEKLKRKCILNTYLTS